MALLPSDSFSFLADGWDESKDWKIAMGKLVGGSKSTWKP